MCVASPVDLRRNRLELDFHEKYRVLSFMRYCGKHGYKLCLT